MHQPLEPHWKAVKHILRYLCGTNDYNLLVMFHSPLNIVAFSDADWASNLDDRKSTIGYCLFLGSNLVTWSVKKQTTIPWSSTEAEYWCLASTTAKITWLQSLLQELQVSFQQPPVIWCDNLNSIALANNPIFHALTKHIELDIHFVCEKFLQQKLSIHHVPSLDHVVDILTKPLSVTRFQHLWDKLHVIPLSRLQGHALYPQKTMLDKSHANISRGNLC